MAELDDDAEKLVAELGHFLHGDDLGRTIVEGYIDWYQGTVITAIDKVVELGAGAEDVEQIVEGLAQFMRDLADGLVEGYAQAANGDAPRMPPTNRAERRRQERENRRNR